MALPGVNVTLSNGNLGGITAIDDGICALITTGVAVSGTLALGTVYKLNSLADATALGITAAYDSTNTCKVYKDVSEFFARANFGSTLYLEVVAKTVTLAAMTLSTNAYVQAIITASNGAVKLIGFNRVPDNGYSPVTSTGIEADVTTAISNAQTTATAFAGQNMPFRVVIAGRGWTGSTTTVPDQRQNSANRVQVCLFASASDGYAAIGRVLVDYSKISVGTNIGAVPLGNVGIDAPYMTDSALVSGKSLSALAAMHDKGYLIVRPYVGKSGFYYNDDSMCAPATDDYCQMALGRIIDKVHRITYGVYLEYVNTTIQVDATTGKLDAAQCKHLEGLVESAVNTLLAGSISSFDAFIDSNQNVISTGYLAIDESVVPLGYLRNINITLGFSNPFN